MTGLLDGRLAVITGGASGLGAAIAERFAAEGAHVVVADIDEAAAEKVAATIAEGGGAATAVAVDVTDGASVAALFARAATIGSPLRALVLSAAIETRASVTECTDDDWQQVIDVNLKGPFLCLKHAMPPMVAAGGGSVIAMGSTLGQLVAPKYAAYCAAKTGLTNLCKQVAVEHAPDGVRVNVLAPAACDTGLFMRMTAMAPDPDAVRRGVAAHVPMRRLGHVDEVADAALFLASDRSTYLSGAVIPLDGGLAARRIV